MYSWQSNEEVEEEIAEHHTRLSERKRASDRELKQTEAKKSYGAVVVFILIALAINYVGINPISALVLAGIVQGFSTPPLLLLIMFMINNPSVMGNQVNGRIVNILGSITTMAIFAGSSGLIVSSII